MAENAVLNDLFTFVDPAVRRNHRTWNRQFWLERLRSGDLVYCRGENKVLPFVLGQTQADGAPTSGRSDFPLVAGLLPVPIPPGASAALDFYRGMHGSLVYVAYRYRTCRSILVDNAMFSSNPFRSGPIDPERLVALNTTESRSWVYRTFSALLRKHYQTAQASRILLPSSSSTHGVVNNDSPAPALDAICPVLLQSPLRDDKSVSKPIPAGCPVSAETVPADGPTLLPEDGSPLIAVVERCVETEFLAPLRSRLDLTSELKGTNVVPLLNRLHMRISLAMLTLPTRLLEKKSESIPPKQGQLSSSEGAASHSSKEEFGAGVGAIDARTKEELHARIDSIDATVIEKFVRYNNAGVQLIAPLGGMGAGVRDIFLASSGVDAARTKGGEPPSVSSAAVLWQLGCAFPGVVRLWWRIGTYHLWKLLRPEQLLGAMVRRALWPPPTIGSAATTSSLDIFWRCLRPAIVRPWQILYQCVDRLLPGTGQDLQSGLWRYPTGLPMVPAYFCDLYDLLRSGGRTGTMATPNVSKDDRNMLGVVSNMSGPCSSSLFNTDDNISYKIVVLQNGNGSIRIALRDSKGNLDLDLGNPEQNPNISKQRRVSDPITFHTLCE